MRIASVLLLLLLLVGAGAWCLAIVPSSPAPSASGTSWVRTRDGWQQRAEWEPRAVVFQPALHPLIVGLGELFVAVGALVAGPLHARRSTARLPRPAAPVPPFSPFGARNTAAPRWRNPLVLPKGLTTETRRARRK